MKEMRIAMFTCSLLNCVVYPLPPWPVSGNITKCKLCYIPPVDPAGKLKTNISYNTEFRTTNVVLGPKLVWANTTLVFLSLFCSFFLLFVFMVFFAFVISSLFLFLLFVYFSLCYCVICPFLDMQQWDSHILCETPNTSHARCKRHETGTSSRRPR